MAQIVSSSSEKTSDLLQNFASKEKSKEVIYDKNFQKNAQVEFSDVVMVSMAK